MDLNQRSPWRPNAPALFSRGPIDPVLLDLPGDLLVDGKDDFIEVLLRRTILGTSD